MSSKLCIVIPNYNHHNRLQALFDTLAKYKLTCILVDDGSNLETKRVIDAIIRSYDFVKLITLANNSGKGVAVIEGFKCAYADGFSHALQVDADYQHDLGDITDFIALSYQYPKALISGKPIYDQSAPKSRVYGRKITNFWVAIETLSLQLAESMCGFRVYPLYQTMNLINQMKLPSGMAFDIAIIVRLYWQGVEVKFIPTKVIYPKDGSSHFKAGRDNIKISLAHTRLFFAMLLRLPKLLLRKFK
ncbi:glycosyltransferase family 2 protein [Thiotrichales bacterium 19S3-7]|nr:glycosyltransferase family 2 protein [Thiotrichales bacterium 19S3-7]MCF6802189.1 glycosyltransferase family 2 protein [Thiotrichales bacterium 19S3-11]